MEDLKSQRLNGLEQMEHGVLARPRPFGCAGVDLKVRQEVMGQRDQLLPGAVSGVAVGRHGVKRQPAFQVTDGLLVVPAAGHEVPQVSDGQREIAGDGRGTS